MKKKILIVDDDEAIAAMMSFFLCGEGWDAFVASTGQAALEQINASRPDLVILDVNLPGLNGFQVCEALKKRRDTKDIPVIFLTVRSRIGDFEKGLSLGAVEYMFKPVEPDELVEAIRTSLAESAHPTLLPPAAPVAPPQ